jgi:hypothetical protein
VEERYTLPAATVVMGNRALVFSRRRLYGQFACGRVKPSPGLTLSNVLSTTIFLKNLDDFSKFNAVYATYFPENPPARATVEVSRLPRDVLIEISLIAGK